MPAISLRRILIPAAFSAAALSSGGQLYLTKWLAMISKSSYERLSFSLSVLVMVFSAVFFFALFRAFLIRNKISFTSKFWSVAVFVAMAAGYGAGRLSTDTSHRFYCRSILSDCTKTKAGVLALSQRRKGKNQKVKLARVVYAVPGSGDYYASINRGELLPGDSVTVCYYNANPTHFSLPGEESL